MHVELTAAVIKSSALLQSLANYLAEPAGGEAFMSAEEFWNRDECGEFRKNRFKKMNRFAFAEAYAAAKEKRK